MEKFGNGVALPCARAGPVFDLSEYHLFVMKHLTMLCDNNAAENGDAQLQKKRG